MKLSEDTTIYKSSMLSSKKACKVTADDNLLLNIKSRKQLYDYFHKNDEDAQTLKRGGANDRCRGVIKVDDENNIIATYASRTECQKIEGFKQPYLSNLITKKEAYKGFYYKNK